MYLHAMVIFSFWAIFDNHFFIFLHIFNFSFVQITFVHVQINIFFKFYFLHSFIPFIKNTQLKKNRIFFYENIHVFLVLLDVNVLSKEVLIVVIKKILIKIIIKY